MDDNKEYAGEVSIEKLEEGKSISNNLKGANSGVNADYIVDIQQYIKDVKDAIEGTFSFEIELGLIGQIQGILKKVRAGIISSADLENLLKQSDELKKSIENDLANIDKFERISEEQSKKLDDILDTSDNLLDTLKKDVGFNDEEKDKWTQDIEKIRESTEAKKIALLPFIGELHKKLEKIKDCEIDILGVLDRVHIELVDKLQKGLVIVVEPDDPSKKIEDPIGLIGKIQAGLEKKEADKGAPEKDKPENKKEAPEKDKPENKKEAPEKDEPEKQADMPIEQVEKRVDNLKIELSNLNMGLIAYLDDFGKTPEFQNILADSKNKNNVTNLSNEVKSNNNIQLSNSEKVMEDAELKKIKERTNDLVKKSNVEAPRLEQNNSKQMDNSKKLENKGPMER